MAAVNAIQYSQPVYLRTQQGAPAGKQSASEVAGVISDRLDLQGENRAVSQTPLRESGCRCGNCPACASRAYLQQDKSLARDSAGQAPEMRSEVAEEGETSDHKSLSAQEPKGLDGSVLTEQERAKVEELKKVDQAVRAHEQAHVAAAGGLVRKGVSLSYEKGPDGRRYAVQGEVSIDTSKEAEPAETINKMRTVRAAALAPSDPSPQDRKVAAAAAVKMADAMTELSLERAGEQGEGAVAQAADRLAGPGQGEDDKSQNQDESRGREMPGSTARTRAQQVAAGYGAPGQIKTGSLRLSV